MISLVSEKNTKTDMENDVEFLVWESVDPNDIWVMDKLILARKMGYVCGPAGQRVPKKGNYVVRPCVNGFGMGAGASVEYLEQSTRHLPPGYFWCEMFEGRHLSVDYYWGQPLYAVEGFKSPDTLTIWDKWVRVKDKVPLPKILTRFGMEYENLNCEFIDGKLIEVHLRGNPNFKYTNKEFIPVYEGQPSEPPEGYEFVSCPELNGRIGAFIK